MLAAGGSLLLGLLMVVGGAELLVRGASRLASALRVAPLLVGLSVVAYGTSAPEFAASVGAAAGGRAALAVGNVLGSNTFNVLFILGVSALVVPLTVSVQVVRFGVPAMIGVTAGAWGLALDGSLGRLDGLTLTAAALAFTVAVVWLARRHPVTASLVHAETPTGPSRGGLWARAGDLVRIVAGLVALVYGAGWLVGGAVSLARGIGVSELVVGATLVAAGTSLPEVAASVVAVVRGQRDLAVGNVVGSNLINLTGVLGVSAVVAPGGLGVPPGAATFEFAVATFAAVACLPVFFTGARIARWEGALLLAAYGAYLAYLSLRASEHPVRPAFGEAMLYFALPLTVITLIATVWRDRRRLR